MIFRMGLELRGGPSIPVAFPPRCTRPRGRKIPPIGHQEIIPNFVPARGHLAFLAHVAAAVSRLPYLPNRQASSFSFSFSFSPFRRLGRAFWRSAIFAIWKDQKESKKRE